MTEERQQDHANEPEHEEEPQIKLEEDVKPSAWTSLTEPIPIATSAERGSADAVREWLLEIWDRGAPQDLSAQREKFAAWFSSTFEPRDLFSPAQPGSRARVEGFRGSVGDIRLQVRAAADAAGQDRANKLSLFNTIAATMRRMEQDDQGTREDRVDVVLAGLMALRPQCSGDLRTFVAGLRGYLEFQQARDAGFYATIGTLASVLRNAEGRPCLEQAMYLYHEGIAKFADGPADITSAMVGVLRITCNNAARRPG